MTLERFLEKVRNAPWYRLLGLNVEVENAISIVLEVQEKHFQALGIAHGGVAATILDSAIGLNINKELVSRSKIAVTSQLNVHYLKPVQRGKVKATARPLYIGSKVAVGFGELKDEKGETLAVATATFYIREIDSELIE
ncbi:MAG: PaaI family thioesterase [Archaeoglobaceae archaeon]|nr:PaaI family thioesterase [Archaeoglobaceae archaeon]MDW7990141.1 PaaI family thioesterase [Archaeoglobaceae archaeon]